MKRITSKELMLLSHNFQVRFALFCAYQVKDKWELIPECVEAVRVTELWLEGKASSEECEAAADAATRATYATTDAAYAAYAAGCTSEAAAYAANAAAYAGAAADAAAYDAYKNKTVKDQWGFYHELLHFDENAEKALLGEEI